MRTVICLVFLTLWEFISVLSVYAIRVPTNWNDVNRRNGADIGYVSQRFSRRNDGPGSYATSLGKKDFANNVQDTRSSINSPYQSLQQNIPMVQQANSRMILSPNGLYIVPQSQKDSFPPRQNSRFASEALKSSLDNRYQSESQHAQSYIPINKSYKKYQQIPDNVLGMQPLGVVDKYQQLKEAQKRQEVVNRLILQYNPELFKQNPEASSRYTSQPLTDLKQWALPQNHPLTVSASEEDATLNPLGFNQNVDYSTKKEPVFFVTEGYTNVLLQGPHHKKKYVESNQRHAESNEVANQQKLENDDKTPQKRKVTKIYRIHNNLGGPHRNLVETDELKPSVKARYFQRPKLYNDEERRMGLEKHLRTNYRDDTLHESINDKDDERDDNEDERVLNEDDVDDENDKISIDEVTEAHIDVNTTAKEEETNATTESNDGIEEEAIADKSEPNVEIKKSDDEIVHTQEEEEQTEINLTNKAEGDENKEENLEDQEEAEEDDDELDEPDDKNQNKPVPHSEHADPKPPPTKPIYPGQGFWANPELKHRPHISQHRFFGPAEQEKKPDGYDVFEDLEQFFKRQKNNFGNTFSHEETTTEANSPYSNYFESIRTPSPVNPIPVYDPFIESSNKNSAETAEEPIKVITEIPEASTSDNKYNTDASSSEKTESNEDADNSEAEEENEELEENEEDTDSEDEEADEFVPLKLYTQVRNHENVEHEPYNPLEHGRLREVIKDSKVQTVYTEEGYEDAAYDHAGHEKNAEKDQGYAEFERIKKGPEKEAENVKADAPDSIEGLSKKVPVLNDAKTVFTDSLASDSSFPLTPKENAIQDSDKKKLQKNNFISTQEVKTTQLKDKSNGNMELEIESEVKIIMQPNNSSESHKYVKIYPKVLKEIGKEHISQNLPHPFEEKVPSNETDKDSSTTESSTVSEIESITRDYSTHKPRVVVKAIDENGALRTIIGEDKIRRTRRSVELSPFGGFDTDLKVLKNINHTFEPAKPEIDVEKYPYYVLPDLNEDSPLRYAENFDKVPKKAEGELTFYQAADQHECPEIPQSIDPIPENVKNAHLKKGEDEESEEYEDENDDEEESVVDKKRPATPKTPRIQLGDKIDCLKARYFGENPLDSPFFKEQTVGPVKPIFKAFERSVLQKKPIKNIAAWRRSDDNVVNTNEVFDQSEKVDKKIIEAKAEATGARPESISSTEKAEVAESIKLISKVSKPLEFKVNDVAHQVKPTASPLVTLITTPRYTIQLTPKNIYDQIKLLDHLPEDNDDSDNASKAVTEKKEEETTSQNGNVDGNNQKEESSQREPKILVGDITGPEAEALRRRRMRPRRPAVYQIFDVNRFLTTTPFNLIDSASTTVLPKHKVLSEVYYKDEIKPSEQLNVFTDVLNNIQNSSKMNNAPMQSASDFGEPSAVIVSSFEESTIIPRESTPSVVRVKKFQSDSSYSLQNNIEVPKTTLRPPAPTRQMPVSYNIKKHFSNNQIPVRRQPNVAAQDFKSKQPQNNHYYSTSTSRTFRPSQLVPQLSTTTLPSKRKLFKRRRKPSSTTTTTTTIRTTTNNHVTKQNTPNNHQPYIINFIEDTGKVVGMVPPQNFEYRTIIVDNSEDRDGPESYKEQSLASEVSVIPVTEPTDEAPPKKPLNRYLFRGLRPPVPQKVRPYSDYLVNGALVNENLLRRRVSHVGNFRLKREAARASYADLSRNRGRQTAGSEESFSADDDVDDYVPHRPKNFHYDEKTGKIIYHNKPKPKEEEEEEEYEEIEVADTPGKYLETAEDATHPTPEKVTTKELLATATPPPEGKGLLDFVLKVKNNPTYQFIPDPTTRKPGSEPDTTEAFATVDPKSTNPPEFLNILSKVKSDSNYKYIEDPKESKKKLKTTTPIPEEELEEEEEEEETLPKHIQNSPGGQAQNLGNIDIFDIGDYLPKIKTVMPKTGIDYSKYKTIQRNHPKTTPSTMEEDDEEEDEGLGRRDEIHTKQDHSRERYKTIRRPEVDREEESIDRLIISEERAEPKVVSEKPTTTSTTQRIVQLRRGTRPTTRRTTVEVFEAKEATTTARSAIRRRPVITRGTRRPTVYSDTTEKIAKVYPANYSTDSIDHMQSASFEKAKRVYRRRPVRIRPTTKPQEEDRDDIDKIVRRSIDNNFDYVKDEFEKASLGR